MHHQEVHYRRGSQRINGMFSIAPSEVYFLWQVNKMRSEPFRATTEQYSRSTLAKEALHGTNSPWLLELKADHKQSPRAGVRLNHILAWSMWSWQLSLNAWQPDEPAVHQWKQPRVVDPRPGSADQKRAFYPTTNQWHGSGPYKSFCWALYQRWTSMWVNTWSTCKRKPGVLPEEPTYCLTARSARNTTPDIPTMYRQN